MEYTVYDTRILISEVPISGIYGSERFLAVKHDPRFEIWYWWVEALLSGHGRPPNYYVLLEMAPNGCECSFAEAVADGMDKAEAWLRSERAATEKS